MLAGRKQKISPPLYRRASFLPSLYTESGASAGEGIASAALLADVTLERNEATVRGSANISPSLLESAVRAYASACAWRRRRRTYCCEGRRDGGAHGGARREGGDPRGCADKAADGDRRGGAA